MSESRLNPATRVQIDDYLMVRFDKYEKDKWEHTQNIIKIVAVIASGVVGLVGWALYSTLNTAISSAKSEGEYAARQQITNLIGTEDFGKKRVDAEVAVRLAREAMEAAKKRAAEAESELAILQKKFQNANSFTEAINTADVRYRELFSQSNMQEEIRKMMANLVPSNFQSDIQGNIQKNIRLNFQFLAGPLGYTPSQAPPPQCPPGWLDNASNTKEENYYVRDTDGRVNRYMRVCYQVLF